MDFCFAGDTGGIMAGIAELSAMLGYRISPGGLPVHARVGCPGLRVTGAGAGYCIEYGGKPEFFRGLAILAGKIKSGETCFEVAETRKLESCGVMIDTSRNAVPRVGTLKEYLRFMALMGMDTMLLYMEDTYELEG